MKGDYAVWKKKREQLKHALARKERERATFCRGIMTRSADKPAEQPLAGLCDELRDAARDQGKTALRRHAPQVTDTMFELFQELDAINHELAKSFKRVRRVTQQKQCAPDARRSQRRTSCRWRKCRKRIPTSAKRLI